MVFLKLSPSLLFTTFICITILLSFLGIRASGSLQSDKAFHLSSSWIFWVFLFLASALIVWQANMYIGGVHIDQDDARWVAESNDVLATNTMFLYNPATGEYVGSFIQELSKDAISPFPVYIALISRITGIAPAIFYHTVYPPFLLLLSYFAYYLIAQQLFEGSIERVIFVFNVALINLFFSGEGYTQSAFELTRIWQGKSIVASLIIPVLIWQFLILFREQMCNFYWFRLAIIICASCLLSGMGILLPLILVSMYGFYIICNKRFKDLPFLFISLLPALLFEVLYYVIS